MRIRSIEAADQERHLDDAASERNYTSVGWIDKRQLLL
jgi:hypothetical protein